MASKPLGRGALSGLGFNLSPSLLILFPAFAVIFHMATACSWSHSEISMLIICHLLSLFSWFIYPSGVFFSLRIVGLASLVILRSLSNLVYGVLSCQCTAHPCSELWHGTWLLFSDILLEFMLGVDNLRSPLHLLTFGLNLTVTKSARSSTVYLSLLCWFGTLWPGSLILSFINKVHI